MASAAAPQPLPLADPRRPRPEPNLIYRDRDGDVKPVSHTAAINPASAADAAVLPAAGWHAPGQADRNATPARRGPYDRGHAPALDGGGQADGRGIGRGSAKPATAPLCGFGFRSPGSSQCHISQ